MNTNEQIVSDLAEAWRTLNPDRESGGLCPSVYSNYGLRRVTYCVDALTIPRKC